MRRLLKPEKRLIVALDFDPQKEGGLRKTYSRVLTMGESLAELGVIIKINSILRALGYTLISELQQMGLDVFADLKFIDIPNTMEADARLLAEFQPNIATVMCCAGIDGVRRVQTFLGKTTEVLGVTILTSLGDEGCQDIFSCSPEDGVKRFAHVAQKAGLPGLILSPQEAAVVRADRELTLGLNTPGVRPKWSIVKDDDQARVLTIREAFRAGVDRLVIGRPITQADDPRGAVMRTLDEIASAQEESDETD